MAISKITYKASPSATPETWMDATGATAAASDITSPKTAMLADGIVTVGTGSGGGNANVSQDANGYIVLDDAAPGGGGGSVTITNIFNPSTTYIAGYLSGTGTISNPGSVTKEVTTDFISVSQFANATLYSCIKLGSSVAPWVAVCFYDANYTKNGGRSPVIDIGNTNTFGSNYWVEHQRGNTHSYGAGSILIPSTAVYMRVSFRTGGDAELVFAQDSQAIESYWDHSANGMVFVNPFISDGMAT